MRPVILMCLSVVSGYAANAQFSILPQLGLENSKTAVSFNKESFASPLGGKLSPQAALRFEYAFKKGHGPFLGLATSRSLVNYNFSNPETGATAFTASRGGTQLRLEGGYQLSTKPIFFKSSTPSRTTSTSEYKKSGGQCSKSIARSSCGSKSSKATAAKSVDKRSWVRIQPSLGVAYIPGTPDAGIAKTAPTNYAYNAGNWTTGLVSGVGFEFGKGTQRKYVVSLSYVKGLGNLGEQTMTTQVGNKPITTSLQSNTAAWNIRMGVPITFAKKQPVQKQATPQKRCGQYKMQYKSSCTRRVI